jgi:predicted unusual protein kinase regulating ubiquinone biosynthesis (AarF/ABC1/UbiB family)
MQDKIEAFSTAEARRIVEEDLGAPVDTLFSDFSPEPIAAASLAQVYRATLRSTGASPLSHRAARLIHSTPTAAPQPSECIHCSLSGS